MSALCAVGGKPILVAYFILVHRYPEQFKRLFRAIYSELNCYAIHVDKSSGLALSDDIGDFLAEFDNVAIIDPQAALWGGYSLVDAELRGMQKLLEMAPNWKYFINLSGQDFPLKSQSYIWDFLEENEGCEFIRAVDQAVVRPDTMNRVNDIFVEADGAMLRTGRQRAFIKDARPYIGTQWKAVSRDFCEFVTGDPRVLAYRQFYKNSFIADESFFQTVMMNIGEHGVMMNDDLRTIDWVPDGDIKLRPRNFTVLDMPQLTGSADLFARKFDQYEDTTILGLLESHLETSGAQEYSGQRLAN